MFRSVSSLLFVLLIVCLVCCSCSCLRSLFVVASDHLATLLLPSHLFVVFLSWLFTLYVELCLHNLSDCHHTLFWGPLSQLLYLLVLFWIQLPELSPQLPSPHVSPFPLLWAVLLSLLCFIFGCTTTSVLSCPDYHTSWYSSAAVNVSCSMV